MANGPHEGERTAAYRPAGKFVPPSPEELTARLPNLEVTEVLGHGGMGVVYKGRQPFLDRSVAIKLIRPDFNDDDAQKRFVQEARALAKLTHPYIVSVFDCGKPFGHRPPQRPVLPNRGAFFAEFHLGRSSLGA